MTIILRRPWTSQPTTFVRLRRDSIFTDGALHWWHFHPSYGYLDLVANAHATATGVTYGATGYGQALRYDSGTRYLDVAHGLATDLARGTSNAVFGIRCFLTSLAANTIVLGKDDVAGRQFHWQVSTSGALSWVLGTSTQVATSAGAITTGKWYDLIYTRDGNSHSLFANGVRVAGPTVVGASNDNIAVPLRIGARSYAANENPVTGFVQWAFAGSKHWPDALAKAFYDNSWSVFLGQNIIIPVGTAAATAPTISDLRAINVGATSTQWSIDYTFS